MCVCVCLLSSIGSFPSDTNRTNESEHITRWHFSLFNAPIIAINRPCLFAHFNYEFVFCSYTLTNSYSTFLYYSTQQQFIVSFIFFCLTLILVPLILHFISFYPNQVCLLHFRSYCSIMIKFDVHALWLKNTFVVPPNAITLSNYVWSRLMVAPRWRTSITICISAGLVLLIDLFILPCCIIIWRHLIELCQSSVSFSSYWLRQFASVLCWVQLLASVAAAMESHF